MDSRRWQRAQEIFQAAVELGDERRAAYVEEASAGDAELRALVERLLANDDTPASEISGAVAEAAALPAVEGAFLAVPERIGPYRIAHRLGEGGMGEVYEALQEEPVRRRVALKLIKPGMDTREIVARFESERQALAVMDHPAIARVFDAGATGDGRPFFAMELVRGVPITNYCDAERLTVRQRLELFVQVCEGIQHAHQKGIIHRDIKPSNVLVVVHDGRPSAKIIDFGVARAVARDAAAGTLHTELGQLIGTPEYMSPEQAAGAVGDVDTRSDVYSLGVLLYELLVGALPFESSELRRAGIDEIRRRIREDDPPRPSTRLDSGHATAADLSSRRRTDPRSLARQIRGDLDWITMRALEKERARRYGSTSELIADVRRHLADEPVVAGPPSVSYHVSKFVRRHRLAVAFSSVLVLLLAGFAVVMTVQAGRIARERDRATVQRDIAARERDEAARERERAERVSDFLVDLFRVSDPNESRGNEITARQILDAGAERIDRELGDQPELRTTMMTTMGAVYRSLGLYGEAQRLLEGAVGRARDELGPDHRATLSALGELAHLARKQARYEEAETLYESVLATRERTLGVDHPSTISSRSGLALVYARTGRLEESEALQLRVLADRKRLKGEDHPTVLSTLNNLGTLYGRSERLDEAEAIYVELIEKLRVVHGPDHPSLLRAMQNLASVYWHLDRLDEAEPLYRESVASRIRVLGAEHPSTARARSNLARAWVMLERYEEAESLYRELLPVQEQVLGSDHPETLSTTFDLASLAARRGDRDEALGLLRRILDRGGAPPWLLDNPFFADLEGDADFQAIVAEVRSRLEDE